MNRHTLAANRMKSLLVASMGSCCWNCGSTLDLQIDHPNGRDWKVSAFSFRHRVTRYIKEWHDLKVRLLCADCNASNRLRGVELPAPPGVTPGQLIDVAQPF